MTTLETDASKTLIEIQKTLSAIKDGVEVIALALSAGKNVRLLGGGVTEGDVHKMAVDRLKRIAAETSPDRH
jgi:hypothetical protein